MLQELIAIHKEVIATTPRSFRRYLYELLNWDAKAICIFGDRGVGKTTLICQYLIEKYQTVERALYISADNVNVASLGLFKIAQRFFSKGGEALFIDEVHKYPNWSVEMKNIIDTYRTKQVVFSASSSLDLTKSKGDLSRRVVYYQLYGLSFREYLNLTQGSDLPAYSFSEIIDNHAKIVEEINMSHILKHSHAYFSHGYYPFVLEGLEDYLSKVNNMIDKVIYEDIAVVYNLKQTTLPILKKILWLVATTDSFVPNVDRMSNTFNVSREMIYNALEYLNRSGLLNNLFPFAKGNALLRKPGKIYLNNPNLLYAINGSIKLDARRGTVRETFFVNQLGVTEKVDLHHKGDFIINGKYVIEVGGKSKKEKQIKGLKDAYLAVDDIEIGFNKKIPLYLFGMSY